MEQERLPNDLDTAIDSMLQIFPQAFEKLTSEFEIWTGRKAKGLPGRVDLRVIERKLRGMTRVIRQLEELRGTPLNPESANKAYQLLNRLVRLTVPRIPKNEEPIKHLIQQIRRLSEVPSVTLPPGLDYRTKHLGLRAFVYELVASVDQARLDAFLQSALTERQLVAQVQRIFNKMALPKEFEKPLSKASSKAVERLKLALRDVTADWDALINLPYGLILLRQGKQPTWASIRRASLGMKKVPAVRNYPQLMPLAREEWVTVRNSLAHGQAFFDPANESIEFPDRAGKVSWHIEEASLQGTDIYLANTAMLGTWNFVQAARLQAFEAQVIALEEIAKG